MPESDSFRVLCDVILEASCPVQIVQCQQCKTVPHKVTVGSYGQQSYSGADYKVKEKVIELVVNSSLGG